MNMLERYFAPARGAIREFAGTSAFCEPVDLGLYRRLLPSPFGMPDQALVAIAAFDYLKVAPWPLTRWQEWGAQLKCEWRGNAGWYPVTMPVTKWLPMSAGRYLGYPKLRRRQHQPRASWRRLVSAGRPSRCAATGDAL